jgi:hypothetical protein
MVAVAARCAQADYHHQDTANTVLGITLTDEYLT